MMNYTDILQALNTAVTRRNIALHRGAETMRLGWEARAKHLAAQAGVKLVRMPERPHAIIADVFLNRLPVS